MGDEKEKEKEKEKKDPALNLLSSFVSKVLKPRFEEDTVDRLNYMLTCIVVIFFAIIIAAQEYLITGKAIQCWTPNQFTEAWEQYVENYCFVENTYWLSTAEEIPTRLEDRDGRILSYYQWVPFILALQGLMFYIPHVIWRMLNWISGIQIRAVIGMATDFKNMTGKREETIAMIARHISNGIRMHDSMNRNRIPLTRILYCGISGGHFISILYVLVKILFITNLVGQFFILQSFLGPNYTFWGHLILKDLLETNKDWSLTGHFPRKTFCDFSIRVLGNVQRHTVECVLPVNMYNEKIFLFLWWWFLLILTLTFVNTIYWTTISFAPRLRRRFVVRMLAVHDLPEANKRVSLRDFTDKFLSPDAIFTLRLMSQNAGEVTTSFVLRELWLEYRKQQTHGTHSESKVSDPEYEDTRSLM